MSATADIGDVSPCNSSSVESLAIIAMQWYP
jgi:hypothetical protein